MVEWAYENDSLHVQEAPRYASPRLLDKASFVQRYPQVLPFASERLQKDRALVRKMIRKTHGGAFKYAQYFHDDRTMILLAIAERSWYFEYASDRLKNNKKYVLEAIVKTKGHAFDYVSNELKDDKEVALAAV